MSQEGITFLVFILGLVAILCSIAGLIAWSVNRSVRLEEEEHARQKAEHEAWLTEEKRKPQAILQVITTNGETIYSNPVEPDYDFFLNKWYRYTSVQKAHDTARIIMKGGHFRKGDSRWPHHVIRKVTVVPNEKYEE